MVMGSVVKGLDVDREMERESVWALRGFNFVRRMFFFGMQDFLGVKAHNK